MLHLKKYVNEILNFSNWCLQHQHHWLTDFGSRQLQQIQQQWPSKCHCPYCIQVKLQFKTLLRYAMEDPLIHFDAITPEGYMADIMHCRHSSHHGYLSKSAYGDKRATFFHLFCLHNRLGFPDEFARELANLFCGFFCQLLILLSYLLVLPRHRQQLLVVVQCTRKGRIHLALISMRTCAFGSCSGVLWRVFLHTVFLYCLGILHAGQTKLQTSNSTRFLRHHHLIHLKSTLGTQRLIKQEMMQSIHTIFMLTHCALLFAQCLHCRCTLHVVSMSSKWKMTCCFQDPTSTNDSQTTLNASFHSIQMR